MCLLFYQLYGPRDGDPSQAAKICPGRLLECKGRSTRKLADTKKNTSETIFLFHRLKNIHWNLLTAKGGRDAVVKSLRQCAVAMTVCALVSILWIEAWLLGLIW